MSGQDVPPSTTKTVMKPTMTIKDLKAAMSQSSAGSAPKTSSSGQPGSVPVKSKAAPVSSPDLSMRVVSSLRYCVPWHCHGPLSAMLLLLLLVLFPLNNKQLINTKHNSPFFLDCFRRNQRLPRLVSRTPRAKSNRRNLSRHITSSLRNSLKSTKPRIQTLSKPK